MMNGPGSARLPIRGSRDRPYPGRSNFVPSHLRGALRYKITTLTKRKQCHRMLITGDLFIFKLMNLITVFVKFVLFKTFYREGRLGLLILGSERPCGSLWFAG